MNKLQSAKRAQILACLVEGNSLRVISQLADVSINTITKLLVDAGRACSEYQDKALRNLPCKRIQCDENWSFVGCKEKNATTEKKRKGHSDIWTWTALDPDSKLVPCWFIGTRDAGCAHHFMHDLAARLSSHVQLTTDGHKAYLSAVESAFGSEIDYAMLVKIYGNEQPHGDEVRYSPAVCMGAKKAVINGAPVFEHVSTSVTERNNLTIQMSIRRFTHLTNAFSKKVENHEHAVALHFMHYNFCRIHKSLQVTPAMKTGLTDHAWEISEIVDLIDGSSN